jgi:hypothetical protein
MVGEVIAIAGFGLTTLAYLAKIQGHLDGRFDAAERHALKQDAELQLLNSKMESAHSFHEYRIRALEDAVRPGHMTNNPRGN